MKLLYRCCAGLDIQRDTVRACVRRRGRGQAEAVIEEQVFGTFTQDLERLRAWLKQHKVRQVAMEFTGCVLDTGVEHIGAQVPPHTCESKD
jgi:hypothetical protein